MTPHPLLFLLLTACVHSWPQLSFVNDVYPRDLSLSPTNHDEREVRQLPVDEDLDMSAVTLSAVNKLPERRRNKGRQLPLDDDLDMSAVTLPVTNRRPGQRHHARQLPVDEDLEPSAVTLPVPSRRRGLTGAGAERVKARQLLDEEINSPGVLTLPVVHSTKPGARKRAVEVDLAKRSDVAYYAQLNLGTPPQPVFVQLDTGSFELWVNPDCTVLPDRDVNFCEAVGYYDPALSETVSEMAWTQELRYGIGAANISYVRDSIGLPGSTATLRGVQFGVATSTEDQFAGILGLGHGHGYMTIYRTFLDELVFQNITSTRAFSLGLGAKDSGEGSITFGGVDTAKFAGGLAPVPIIPADEAPDGVSRYWVQLEGISLSRPNSSAGEVYDGSQTAVFLDSGATLTLLPPALASSIAADFGSPGEDEGGFYPVDCGLVDMEGTLDFAFGGVTVKVPYREMIRELRSPERCYLGIVPSEEFALLGDTFLRSAYVVFDPDDSMTYIAQYEDCGSMVRSLASTDAISAVHGVCRLTEDSILPTELEPESGPESESEEGDSAEGEGDGQTGGEPPSRDQTGEGSRMGAAVHWASAVVVAAWWLI